MGNLSTELVRALNLLLPGFVAAWVFYGLTAHPRPSPFERVVQALVFNVIIQPFVFATEYMLTTLGRYTALGPWSVESETTASVVFAFILGTVFAGMANSDTIHRCLRTSWPFAPENWRWTWNTSYPSHWYSAFSLETEHFVVLHLTGERRLYGWPDEWPDDPDRGHFILSEPEWLLEDGSRRPAEVVEKIVVPASEVEMVEFIPMQDRAESEQQQE